MYKAALFLCVVALSIGFSVGTACAGETQVRVMDGKVEAVTGQGTVAVEAGHKAVLRDEQKPETILDDPMVRDVIAMYKWANADRKRAAVRIDGIIVDVENWESMSSTRVAALVEMPAAKAEPGNVVPVGPSSPMEDVKVYDMDGSPLKFDVEKSPQEGYVTYRVHFTKPVAAGDSFRLIVVGVAPGRESLLVKSGPVWNITAGSSADYFASYCEVILPQSAILVNWKTRPLLIYNRNGRTAVMMRSYSVGGEEGRGQCVLGFILADKESVSLEDVPADFTPNGNDSIPFGKDMRTDGTQQNSQSK